MRDDPIIQLSTQLKAIELVVRALFTKWAMENNPADPRTAAFRLIELTIGSMHEAQKTENEEQRIYLEMVEDALRDFGEQIDIRLSRTAIEGERG
ncbi:MAG: hypothetical protein AB7F74_22750 [Parvibaculaceae bacterium]